jgi:hypothetical protein
MSGNENIKLTAMMMLEVLGRPPEHLVETLNELIEKIGKEKGVKVIDFKIKEPTLIKDQKDLFTTFAEIEIEVEQPLILAILMFKYMPAHIDVIEPENIHLTNNGFADILSELTRRLHSYEEIVRLLQTEKNILEKQLKSKKE